MTQTAVSALAQGQNSATFTTSPSTANSRAASDRLDPNAQLAPAGSASLENSNVDRDSPHLAGHNPPLAYPAPLMNGVVGTAPPGAMYVRALYDYEADDRTSLSFHEGDVIQVITQLESGWWDGVINGVRGWFPSNYCQIITSPDELPETEQNGVGVAEQPDEEMEEDVYEEGFDDDDDDDGDDNMGLPMEGTIPENRSGADFWIPQATGDGRLYYFNTLTGELSAELPLESPTTAGETGPRDRTNVNIPERTRPPPEMLARGLTQDEDEDSEANSASELEGETIMMASQGSLVRQKLPVAPFVCFPRVQVELTRAYSSLASVVRSRTTVSRQPRRWSPSMASLPYRVRETTSSTTSPCRSARRL